MQRPLTIADFAPRQGRPFKVHTSSGVLQLRLAQVQALPVSQREGGAFRLEFHGPPQPVLAQGVYGFELGGQRSDIFIVPIGALAAAIRYEAIFY